jgi:hypothetical protein
MRNLPSDLIQPAPGRAAIGLALAVLVAACSTWPDPGEKIAASRAAIGSATTSGARELATAELNQAQQKLKGAEEAAALNDRPRANMLAEQAFVDARVADVKARESKARKAASELQEANRALQEEITRSRPTN